ncbi:hypothetical protein Q0Z83_064260 [Actinoplanes sichuanensis]|uniref:Uncharacterized protein n=1 Tax=Actinoplanes sichuanensis TaxID=512349 RepID=A0ABW4AMR0_9ACTN|nr:hypothetical protein [Actinoplanes sichuanensis]BEL08235.1 hypothetical protein Q0Z83_064260 [Actinoplanes sichuanensis]
MGRYWWSIEILDGPHSSAARWRDTYQETMVSAAVSFGAKEWSWHVFGWGVLFEIAFDSEETWPDFRALPAVQAALDAAPDPVNGLLIYPGRGGSAGRTVPRRPRPTAGAGAVPLPREEQRTRVTLATAEPAPTQAGVLV